MLEIVTREEFAAFVNQNKQLEAKPFESISACSMMYVDSDGITQAQAIYFKQGKPIYKVRK